MVDRTVLSTDYFLWLDMKMKKRSISKVFKSKHIWHKGSTFLACLFWKRGSIEKCKMYLKYHIMRSYMVNHNILSDGE